MKRLVALLGATALLGACGVRSPPLPPYPPEARPGAGDPKMVPTATQRSTAPAPADLSPAGAQNPSYPDGGPAWLLKKAADAGELGPGGTTP